MTQISVGMQFVFDGQTYEVTYVEADHWVASAINGGIGGATGRGMPREGGSYIEITWGPYAEPENAEAPAPKGGQ